MNHPLLIYLLKVCLMTALVVHAIIPTGHLKFEDEEMQELYEESYDDTPMYAAPAFWARGLPPEHTAVYRRLLLPSNSDDTTGCKPVLKDPSATSDNFYLLVERGECSFEHKGREAERLGALGLIVYNSLRGIYKNNNYADPEDYDCNRGQAWLDLQKEGSKYKDLPPWHENIVTDMPTLCTESSSCESRQCLLTNVTDVVNGTKVCCAWDLFLEMGSDPPPPERAPQDEKSDIEKVGIPVVFVTMRVGDRLLKFAKNRAEGLMGITMFQRPTPSLDLASCMIWLIAILTVYTAADMISKKEKAADVDINSLSPSAGHVVQDNDSSTIDGDMINDNSSSIADVEKAEGGSDSNNDNDRCEGDDDSIDITPQSAMMFMLIASCALLIFFFFDMHVVILSIYVMGATLSVAIVFVYPRLKVKSLNGLSSAEIAKAQYSKKDGNSDNDWDMIFSLLIAAVVTSIWFFNRHRAWSWIIQDFMGASVCLCFLSYIRLPNLKVATLLLSLAFCYDVFFVFITPYLFGSSVMVHVAEGNPNPQHADPNFCEKYPDNPDCADTTAPNLLVVPSMNDYRGGTCMLGLGDIILPGLFLVLVARIDVRQMGHILNDDIFVGLFGIAIVGYGFALIIANEAVVFFQFGQPALLYIVPFMLFPVLWKCYHDKTIDVLWERMPLMRSRAVVVNEEQRLLLDANDEVVKASASWGESTGELNIKVRGSSHSRKRGTSSGVMAGRNSDSMDNNSSHHSTD